MAESVVVKGRYENGVFTSSEILTKCPSKYEAKAADIKQ
jgi:cytochrome c-type biogenesis protein CcmE